MSERKTPTRQSVLEVVVACFAEKKDQAAEWVNEETTIFSYSAEESLNSLDLVILITDIEQRLQEDYGIDVDLANDRAMSQTNSPFRSVQTLTSYICEILEVTDGK